MKNNRWLVPCWFMGFVLILIATYSNHFNNGFHFDDFAAASENPYIQTLKNIPRFFSDATTHTLTVSNQTYRPLLTTSFAIDYWIGNGAVPFWFQLSTFIWFILTCFLIFKLYNKVADSALSNAWNTCFALLAMTWYGLHTANAETINYISARSDVLSTVWMLIAFVLFLGYKNARKWGLYLIAFVLSLLFKEVGIVFPILLFFYVLYFEEQVGLNQLATRSGLSAFGRAFKTVLPSLIVGAVMLIFLLKMQSATLHTSNFSVYQYLITQPYVALHYVINFVLPLYLTADSDLSVFQSAGDGYALLGFAFVLVMLGIAFWTSKYAKTRPISFGILWFFIALIPTSSLVPLAEVLNDHRTFFPYIGLMLAVSYSVYLLLLRWSDVLRQSVTMRVILVMVLLALLEAHAIGTHQRNVVWSSDETLWQDAIAKSPKNGRAYMNYGLTNMAKGNYPLAEQNFLKAKELWPRYGYVYINLGILKNAQGKPAEAEPYFKQGIQLQPLAPNLRYYYAVYLKSNNRLADAENELINTIRLFPNDLLNRQLLMKLYYEQNKTDKLQALAKDVLRLNPNDWTAKWYLAGLGSTQPEIARRKWITESNPTADNYLNLSLIYCQKKEYEHCLVAAQQALKLHPNYSAAYNNICFAYNELKQYNQAEIACQQAITIDPNNQLAKNNLADVQRRKVAAGQLLPVK